MAQDRSVSLEEHAPRMIHQEKEHIDEIDKMLRQPGQIQVSKEEAETSS